MDANAPSEPSRDEEFTVDLLSFFFLFFLKGAFKVALIGVYILSLAASYRVVASVGLIVKAKFLFVCEVTTVFLNGSNVYDHCCFLHGGGWLVGGVPRPAYY